MFLLSQYYLQAMDKDPVTGRPMPKTSTRLVGSWIRLAAEAKPTAADGVQDGDDLLLVDTKESFIFYKGTWYAQ
jgi:hypothetical protein